MADDHFDDVPDEFEIDVLPEIGEGDDEPGEHRAAGGTRRPSGEDAEDEDALPATGRGGQPDHLQQSIDRLAQTNAAMQSQLHLQTAQTLYARAETLSADIARLEYSREVAKRGNDAVEFIRLDGLIKDGVSKRDDLVAKSTEAYNQSQSVTVQRTQQDPVQAWLGAQGDKLKFSRDARGEFLPTNAAAKRVLEISYELRAGGYPPGSDLFARQLAKRMAKEMPDKFGSAAQGSRTPGTTTVASHTRRVPARSGVAASGGEGGAARTPGVVAGSGGKVSLPKAYIDNVKKTEKGRDWDTNPATRNHYTRLFVANEKKIGIENRQTGRGR